MHTHQFKPIDPEYGWFSYSGNYEANSQKKAALGVIMSIGYGNFYHQKHKKIGRQLSLVIHLNKGHSYAGIQCVFLFPVISGSKPIKSE